MFEFALPALGADMDAGTLLEWCVKPGDAVKKGQVVAVVDTAKAAIDVEIWQDGTVHELLAEPGTRLAVGSVMATLLEPGESAPAPMKAAVRRQRRGAPAAAGAAAATALSGAATMATRAGAGAAAAGGLGAQAGEGGRQRVSPAARRRAEALGVELATLQGSGPGGAVRLADVERAGAAAVAPAAAAAGVPAPAVREQAPADRQAEMRRTIAAAMSRSKREIPHYYLLETIPLARAQAWLAQANAERPMSARLLMAALQLKAVALALKRYPELNGFFRDGGFEPAAAVHIGVAISLRQGGLIAPALHDVDRLALDELMRALTELVRRARAGSLRSSELADPSITVTNLGDEGTEAVVGVIYPPQVALVGFGRVTVRPWVEEGALCAMPTVTASLAADHRVSDGHRGARFLAEVRELLQRPEEL